ncbi:MAG: dephospho-CoA kinase [Proteobacteria bacterium]|nr:dephospho-CoA kinase [Pseudomonadota bacterium]
MKKIGLTGGMGVGKSTVAGFFAEIAGAAVLDADEVARSLRAPGGAAEAPILARFGTLDRAELRKILSTDPKAKADLEGILHPLIREKSDHEIKRIEMENPSAPFLIYEASLLIESGRAPDFDAIVVVTAPLPDRLSRIMNRDGISKDAALAMIAAQSTDEFRLQHADFHIQNLGNLDELRAQVEKTVAKTVDQIRSS